MDREGATPRCDRSCLRPHHTLYRVSPSPAHWRATHVRNEDHVEPDSSRQCRSAHTRVALDHVQAGSHHSNWFEHRARVGWKKVPTRPPHPRAYPPCSTGGDELLSRLRAVRTQVSSLSPRLTSRSSDRSCNATNRADLANNPSGTSRITRTSDGRRGPPSCWT